MYKCPLSCKEQNCAQELSEIKILDRVTNSKCTPTRSHQSVASRHVLGMHANPGIDDVQYIIYLGGLGV